ncbi:HGR027Cp [Eremothecium sinecaudum]|uniref:Origin recognition complex subunit 2 n=1 Tax=Eremothecium sinecaudum TaxID=45286 RepID=A0A109V067_9SACH|nr:HGR027Cp [Eremothecium sinecaudum]AMD22366.1 HGR027Cp [Eremothecium sinecaudum]
MDDENLESGIVGHSGILVSPKDCEPQQPIETPLNTVQRLACKPTATMRQGRSSPRRITKDSKEVIVLGVQEPDVSISPKKRGRPRKQAKLNGGCEIPDINSNNDKYDDNDKNSSKNHTPVDPPISPRRKLRIIESTSPIKQVQARRSGTDDTDAGDDCNIESFATAVTTPFKSPRCQLTFNSPTKSPTNSKHSDMVLPQSHRSIKLDRDFVPTPVPNNYKLPDDRNLTYFFDGFEGYIDQKKPLRAHKKSRSSMVMAQATSKEEFSLLSSALNPYLHNTPRLALKSLQRKLFPQYWFEVLQGFTLLFYGIGSKRQFLDEFVVEYLSPKLSLQYDENLNYDPDADVMGVPVVVINGYNPTCGYRDCFQSIADIMLPEELSRSETKYWNNHVHLQIQKMINYWAHESPEVRLIVLVHNLDGPMLRKDAFQLMLSSLARIRQIAIIASIDNINAPLLWDSLRSQTYNFVFHDITNYDNYSIETTFQNRVNLRNSEVQAGGIDAVKYVLESLTVNSKRLFKLLLQTIKDTMEAAKRIKLTDSRRAGTAFGVPFKSFYQSCASQFIASNELSLRAMLREFIEHKMAHMASDKTGQEAIYINYTFGEIKTLLSEILADI